MTQLVFGAPELDGIVKKQFFFVFTFWYTFRCVGGLCACFRAAWHVWPMLAFSGVGPAMLAEKRAGATWIHTFASFFLLVYLFVFLFDAVSEAIMLASHRAYLNRLQLPF